MDTHICIINKVTLIFSNLAKNYKSRVLVPRRIAWIYHQLPDFIMAHNYDNDNVERTIISFGKRMHGGENQKDNDNDALGSKFAYLINVTEVAKISNRAECFVFAIRDTC